MGAKWGGARQGAVARGAVQHSNGLENGARHAGVKGAYPRRPEYGSMTTISVARWLLTA